jgi:hypothetical protein
MRAHLAHPSHQGLGVERGLGHQAQRALHLRLELGLGLLHGDRELLSLGGSTLWGLASQERRCLVFAGDIKAEGGLQPSAGRQIEANRFAVHHWKCLEAALSLTVIFQGEFFQVHVLERRDLDLDASALGR